MTGRNDGAAIHVEAVILGVGATALSVSRCFKKAGIEATVVSFPKRVRVASYSRFCQLRESPYELAQDDEFCSWLLAEFETDGRKALIPETDAAALFIAKFSARLKQRFLVWENTLEGLEDLVSKDRLTELAEKAGISSPPSICSDDIDEISNWAKTVDGPYIVKPLYSGAPGSSVRGEAKKNWVIETRHALLELAEDSLDSSLVIQKYLKAGDGSVFDCYGLCDSNGRIVSAATHKRIRQSVPGRGVTSYGEIPALDPRFSADELISNTEDLFRHFKYHGIFGVEWVWDELTEKLYVVDVNARPFSSIGHLLSSGLNLPALAVYELLKDEAVDSHDYVLTHSYWIDFYKDLFSAAAHFRAGNLSIGTWMGEVWKARSYAYFDAADPLPMLVVFFRLVARLSKGILRRVSALVKRPFA